MRNIFLRVTVLGMICSWALPDSQLDMRKREAAYRYCGPNLANVLRFLCNGSYHIDEHWKRSAGSIHGNNAQDMDDSLWLQPEVAEEVFPFRPWWMANQFRNRFFRRQRSAGIVEECCLFKGCTVSELTEYCAAR